MTCELRNVGKPGSGLLVGEYYDEKTWDLPCINSSLTVKNSALEDVWPAVYGSVYLKVYGSNVADAHLYGPGATLEVYDSTISEIFDYNGGRVYVENSEVSTVIDVRDVGSVVYGYRATGPYQLLKSNGGAYIPLDKPGPPW